jgi:IclR family transcriptional regulator, KDG regulon repressor
MIHFVRIERNYFGGLTVLFAIQYNDTRLFQKWDTVPYNETSKMTNTSKSTTLQRAVSLLNCFTQDEPELGVREIARKVGLSSSTTGRILANLKDLGLLSQNPDTHGYLLGGKVLAWAGVYTATLDVHNRALPYMHELHHTTQETISLYVMEENDRVCVERIESPQNVRIIARIGRRLPLYAGSAGKVFLAYLSPARRKAILDSTVFTPFTPNTFVDRPLLEEEIKKIAKKGYAVSSGEWVQDASGVAAPIFDQWDEIVAVLTISGPTQRFNDENVEKYIAEVTQAAEKISSEMGFHPAKHKIRVNKG